MIRIRYALFLALVLLPVSPFATTFPVTKTADSNDGTCDPDCSLREAIDAANANPGADDVPVPAGFYLLTLGQLVVSDTVRITGAGQTNTIIDGNASFRVLEIQVSGPVEISNLTIQNGYHYGNHSGSGGGGIYHHGDLALTNSTVSNNSAVGYYSRGGGGIRGTGNLTLTNSTVSGNSAEGFYSEGGGGIRVSGNLALTNSTVSNNSAVEQYGGGGGIDHLGQGDVTLINSTVSGNTASFSGGISGSGNITITNSTVSNNHAWMSGGGIGSSYPSTVTFADTIVAGNSTYIAASRYNCSNTSFISLGYNLTDDDSCGFDSLGDLVVADAILGPLADNGGPTKTHALLAGSPALDAGSPDCPPPATDQRGVARPQGAVCDIGALETLGTPPPTPTPMPTPTPHPPGSVVGWGRDIWGEATPPDAVNGVAGTATEIAAGSNQSCAIQAGTGDVVCWGDAAPPPDAVNGVSGTATDVAASNHHSCAIQAGTGNVVCWGSYSLYGEEIPPDAVNGVSGAATDISVGGASSCAIQAGTGKVVCWGDDLYGKSTPPDAVNGVSGTATDISVGSASSCAIQAGTGAVVCWGRELFGARTPPNDVNGVSGTATDVAASGHHSCAIQAGTGKVVCWGADNEGQSTPPDAVNGVSGTATEIAVGGSHSCAIQAGTGDVVCWGWNSYRQSTPPDAVNGVLGTATAVSAGGVHSLAIVGGPVPTATPTVTPTPTATPQPPATCTFAWPLTDVSTKAKGQSPSNNGKVMHSVTGNIIQPGLLGDTAHRIPVCAGTEVTAVVTDATGTPTNTADGTLRCDAAGCAGVVNAVERYRSVSRDGRDKDTITFIPE